MKHDNIVKPPPSIWNIEMSHMVAVPQYILAHNLREVRAALRAIADSKITRTDRPAIGRLFYRYDVDDQDRVNVVHSYFVGRNGKQRRFIRVRREA